MLTRPGSCRSGVGATDFVVRFLWLLSSDLCWFCSQLHRLSKRSGLVLRGPRRKRISLPEYRQTTIAKFFTARRAPKFSSHISGWNLAGQCRLAMDQNPHQKTAHAQMGFVHMALVIFLPLFLTALASAFIVMFFIYQLTAADSVCKKEVMRLQRELSRLTQELVRLNKSAAVLRTQRAYADTQLAAARTSGYPPAIAAAEAYQKSIVLAQTLLAAQQKSRLAFAASERLISEQKIRATGALQGMREIRGTLDHSPTLALRAEPASSLTPDYVEESFYRDRQNQTYRYKIQLVERLPDWLRYFVHSHSVLRDLATPTARSCSATLSGKENDWKPILRKDKALWSL